MAGLQVLAILPVMEIKKRICLQDTRKIAMVLKSTGDRCLLGLLRGDLHFPRGASRPIGSHGSLPNADGCYLQAGKSPPSQCSTPPSTRVLHCTHLRSCRAAPHGIDGHIKFSTKAHHNLTLSLSLFNKHLGHPPSHPHPHRPLATSAGVGPRTASTYTYTIWEVARAGR